VRILVIDDEPLVRWAIAEMLEYAGHTVLQGNPHGSLRDSLSRDDYDLVLTDLNMPGMNGWDVAQWVRQHRPHVPVCAISGRIADDLEARWLEAFTAVFRKPVDDTQLLRTIARIASSGSASE
jgi:CheY-like chemotaxis protein